MNIGLDNVYQTRQHINSTATVIQAVLNGRGIALVRKALVQQDFGYWPPGAVVPRTPLANQLVLLCGVFRTVFTAARSESIS